MGTKFWPKQPFYSTIEKNVAFVIQLPKGITIPKRVKALKVDPTRLLKRQRRQRERERESEQEREREKIKREK